MDVPPGSGLTVGPFLAVDAWLRAAGFSAPAVLAADADRGLVLLEDLGDDLFARICAAAPAREGGLYAAAVDLLADLQRLPPPDGAWTPPPYDLAFLLREARLALEWYLPAATGAAAPADLAAEYEARAAEAFAPFATPAVAVYRDYHAENLIWLPERAGHARIGLLDFQDMLVGHPAYDLVSLLEDARRDVSPELRTAMLARYAERSGADAAALDHAAHALSAQRNLKIVGLFSRLARRDGKPRYLELLPRVWRPPRRRPRASGAGAARRARRAAHAAARAAGARADRSGGVRPAAVMIFAAGLGTRMGALTRDRPKPLIPVGGRPLLDHALALARAAGIPRIVVNTHAHPDQMHAHLARVAPDALISHEPELLETGGGLKRALPLLGAGPVLHPQRRHGLDRPEPARRPRRGLAAGRRRAAGAGAAGGGGRACRRRRLLPRRRRPGG